MSRDGRIDFFNRLKSYQTVPGAGSPAKVVLGTLVLGAGVWFRRLHPTEQRRALSNPLMGRAIVVPGLLRRGLQGPEELVLLGLS